MKYRRGRIDHADDAVDHGVTDGDQAIDRAEHEAVDELLGEIVHCCRCLEHFPARCTRFAVERCSLQQIPRRWLRQPERRVLAFSNSGNPVRQQRELALNGGFSGSGPSLRHDIVTQPSLWNPSSTATIGAPSVISGYLNKGDPYV